MRYNRRNGMSTKSKFRVTFNRLKFMLLKSFVLIGLTDLSVVIELQTLHSKFSDTTCKCRNIILF